MYFRFDVCFGLNAKPILCTYFSLFPDMPVLTPRHSTNFTVKISDQWTGYEPSVNRNIYLMLNELPELQIRVLTHRPFTANFGYGALTALILLQHCHKNAKRQALVSRLAGPQDA